MWEAIFPVIVCFSALGLISCLICLCLTSRPSARRQPPSAGPEALPARFQPDQAGHLYSHVIFAERTFQARIAERRTRYGDRENRAELSAPHASQLHPAYLPPAYNECEAAGDQSPPSYAAAVAAASVAL